MTEHNALPLVLLAEQFARLPGIGMKTAQRLAYHVMSMTQDEAQEFADAIVKARKTVHRCSICQNLTENEQCNICSNQRRDSSVICVVESPKDISAFERTNEYNGTYHVLHGLISPIDGITADKLTVRELIARAGQSGVSEVILATSPTAEGDVTAMYIAKMLKALGVRVTRLAFGLPVGAILEYADSVTLFKALENRSEM